jgi:hypothetical protein
MYVISYIDYDGSLISEEFDQLEDAQREWEWANSYDIESLSLTEFLEDK